MFKKIVALCCAAALLFAAAGTAFAGQDKNIEELLRQKKEAGEGARQEISQTLESQTATLNQALNETGGVAVKTGDSDQKDAEIGRYNMEEAFSWIRFENPDFVAEYESLGSIKSMAVSTTQWQVPTSEGY